MRTLGCLLVALVVATAAYAQQKDKQSPATTRALEKEASLNPDSPGAWENLGLTRFHQKRFALAIDAFEHARRLAPRDPQINNNLGYAYLFSKRLDEAIGSFQTVLEIDSHMIAARRGLCSVYALARQPQEAVEACLAAIEDDGKSAVPRYFWRTAISILVTVTRRLLRSPKRRISNQHRQDLCWVRLRLLQHEELQERIVGSSARERSRSERRGAVVSFRRRVCTTARLQKGGRDFA